MSGWNLGFKEDRKYSEGRRVRDNEGKVRKEMNANSQDTHSHICTKSIIVTQP